LREKGLKNEEKWDELITLYQTHPLWLNIISIASNELDNGNVTEFLSEEKDLFIGDIKLYLQPHLEHLSELESKVIHWLATGNKPVNIAEISVNLELSKSKSGEIIQSLLRRCLIEKIVVEDHFYYELNNVFKEYLRESK
jgi:predicted DNA-binding transcriptional regulator